MFILIKSSRIARARWACAGLAAAWTLLVDGALAEPPSVNFRRFTPPLHHQGSVGTEPTTTQGTDQLNVGLWLSYGLEPIQLETTSGDELATPVRDQLMVDAFITKGFGERVSAGIAIPFLLLQTGDETSGLIEGTREATSSGLGDVSLKLKVSIIEPPRIAARPPVGFGLAALGWINTPTGKEGSYVSDAALSGEARLLAAQRWTFVSLRAMAGFYGRSVRRDFLSDKYGNASPWAVSAVLHSQGLTEWKRERWLVTAELRGDIGYGRDFGDAATSFVSFGWSGRYNLGDASLFAGPEFPLSPAAGSPKVRAIAGINWAPRRHDSDADGVLDEMDACPDSAEDKDAFKDADGCPEFDNDQDGVLDSVDRCVVATGERFDPSQLEDHDGYQDQDGCFDPDNDGDGVLEPLDQCPDDPGGNIEGMRAPGCPLIDSDGDGVFDDFDGCPKQAEDIDQFEDTDGCPDPDNDADGVPDVSDACPDQAGDVTHPDQLRGCPNPDPDADAIESSADQCPDEAEDYDGVDDADGCPDDDTAQPTWKRAKPLLGVAQVGPVQVVTLRVQPKLQRASGGGLELDAASLAVARALAQSARGLPEQRLVVFVRPTTHQAVQVGEADALARLLSARINRLALSDGASRPGSYEELKRMPGLGRGPVLVLREAR